MHIVQMQKNVSVMQKSKCNLKVHVVATKTTQKLQQRRLQRSSAVQYRAAVGVRSLRVFV